MESQLHRVLKQAVHVELKREGFTLYVEPTVSPNRRLSWYSYRPDILGISSTKSLFKLTLVECETHPNTIRILNKTLKIQKTLFLQTRLFEQFFFLPLLAIPSLTLDKINQVLIRRFWDIWIINKLGKITHKIPKKPRVKKIVTSTKTDGLMI
ncbi:MAG: hypothetical protein JSV76_07720 [Candidatus Bathyarchaeota archaeon]|nr:MAG: hypothetical protein JSV76_07720 [Candidatus Bathyarchaeota archaeon]